MQHPFEQKVWLGHALFASHTVVPVGHEVMPLHDAGRVAGSCPGHRMHVSPPHSVLPQLPHELLSLMRCPG